jgi:translation initiation factor 2 subunit 3
VLEGVLKLGQEIEVRPGLRMRSTDANGETVLTCQPIRSRAKTLSSEKISLLYAIPGGLIGVGTNIDPALTRQNKLVGNLIGAPGTLPAPTFCVEVEVTLFAYAVGTDAMSSRHAAGMMPRGRPLNRGAPSSSHGAFSPPSSDASPHSAYSTRVARLQIGEQLQINVTSATVAASVVKCRATLAQLKLSAPVCCVAGERLTLCRRMGSHFRLIGWASIRKTMSLQDA